MNSVVSSDQLTFLQPIDSYIKPLGLTRMNFLSLILGIILVIVYFFFSKQLHAWKESIKASLRKKVQGFTVQTHLSEDGKTLETSENPSMMARMLSMIDSMFLAPDNEQEGFQYGDENSEEGSEEEEGFEDEDGDEKDVDPEEGFEDGDEEDEDEDENEEETKEAEVDRVRKLL